MPVIKQANSLSQTLPQESPASRNAEIAKYSQPNNRKAWWQTLNTFIPLAALWCAMYFSTSYSFWLTLLLAIPTAGFLVRVFIIQHDCGHGSFFSSARANDWLGTACGLLTLTPYHLWRRAHARHHATNGNLNHRGHGDVYTLTVDEYLARSPRGRLAYRLYRNPLIMFTVGAAYLFFVQHRLTLGIPRAWRRERKSVLITNLSLIAMFLVAWCTIGLPAFLLVWLPVALLGASAGCWLFFVQHQYENAYWQPQHSWSFEDAALQGSSYYRLPRLLQWFSGNIGFHHIHHLNSRIPGYHLPACFAAEPWLRECPTFGVWESLNCPRLKLWDAQQQRMIGFAELNVRDRGRHGEAAVTNAASPHSP